MEILEAGAENEKEKEVTNGVRSVWRRGICLCFPAM